MIYVVDTSSDDFPVIFRWLRDHGIMLEPIKAGSDQLCFAADDSDPRFMGFLLKYSASLARIEG
jgi:hypothetical protein